jgi:hypothetical protein
VTTVLAQSAWFDDGACADTTGALSPLVGSELALWRLAGNAKKTDSVSQLTRARDAVLVLRGLFVRAALDGEHGTWMIRAAAAEPDVIRVEVKSGAPSKPADVLRTHLAGRAELERVLEHGGALPPNPDVLLPVTRTLTYRPPLRPGESYGVEIEDFSTGWVDRGTARDLELAIRRAWYLAWSRTGAAR